MQLLNFPCVERAMGSFETLPEGRGGGEWWGEGGVRFRHYLPSFEICPWCDSNRLLNGKSQLPGVTAIALLLLSNTSLSISSASRA